MSLPEFTKKQIEKKLESYCDKRVPPHVRDKVQLKFNFRDNSVTLFEERPRWDNPSEKTKTPVAQFRFDTESTKWSLFCSDRNSKWHHYQNIKPSSTFERLLEEVDKDPTGIFWG